jgi:condensation domain-containing protein/phosphopantetheine binding protein
MVGNDELALRLAALPADKRTQFEQRIARLSNEPRTHRISMTQQGLWFLDQMSPGITLYVLGWTVELSGKLDDATLAKAIQSLIDRHDALRTKFEIADGSPVQVVLPEVRTTVPVDDLQHVAESEIAGKVEAACAAAANTGFDLTVAPLIRFRLLRISATRNVLLLTAHHIIFDWLSLDVLLSDLSQLYAAHVAGAALPARPEVQYADFSEWQYKRLQGAHMDKLVDYWNSQLAGVPDVLELPTDRPRPSIKSYAGGEFSQRLDSDLSTWLHQFAKSEHTTLFVVLLSAFQALLSRLTGQSDIPVGSSVSGRTRREFDSIIGYFVNMIVLRSDVSKNPRFRDLAREVRHICIQAYDHQELPFERLVQELRPQRSLGYNPLFQIYFDVIYENDQHEDFAGLQVNSVKNLEVLQVSKFDFGLSAVTSGTEISLDVGYSTDLFDVGSAEQLVARYQLLLTAVSSNPDIRIGDIDLLLPGEYQALTSSGATDVWPLSPSSENGFSGPFNLYVLDPQGGLVPVGVPGELYVGGPGVNRGNLGRPALTAEWFVPDPYGHLGSRLFRTGQFCRWRMPGDLEYLGADDEGSINSAGQEDETACEPPGTPTEQLIAEIWTEVLKVVQIGRNENFFGVSGNSLLAVKAIGLTREMLQVQVPLSTIFEAPTPALFSQALTSYFASPDELDALSASIISVLNMSDDEVQTRLQ